MGATKESFFHGGKIANEYFEKFCSIVADTYFLRLRDSNSIPVFLSRLVCCPLIKVWLRGLVAGSEAR